MGLADDRKPVNLMTVHVSKSVTVHEVSNSIWLSFFLPIFVKNFIVTCNFLFSGKKTGAKICLISTPGFRNTHITTVALISNTIFQYYKEALLF